MKTFKTLFSSITVEAKNNILENLKSFLFLKSSMEFYSEKKYRSKNKFEFDIIGKKFALSKVKPNSKIKAIIYKEIKKYSETIFNERLTDAIFIFNQALFESWIFDLIRLRFSTYPKSFTPSKYDQDLLDEKNISLRIIKDSISLDDLWQKIIDEYVYRIGYKDIEKHIGLLCSHYKIQIKRNDLVGYIKEFSLRRNILMHNKKIVNRFYIEKCGKFAKYKIDEKIVLTEDSIFEQCDALLRFITDFNLEFNKS